MNSTRSSKLIQVSMEQKFSCAKTKAEAIVTNVLAPHVISKVKPKAQQANFKID